MWPLETDGTFALKLVFRRFMKNSFQAHINILDNLKNFYFFWKKFQELWKTVQAI